MTAAAASSLVMSREYLRPPGGMNPNVWMVIIAVGLIATSVGGYWFWGWYDWICFLENVLALHLAGTVIHDASHRAAHSNRAVNTILGHASALMLDLLSRFLPGSISSTTPMSMILKMIRIISFRLAAPSG